MGEQDVDLELVHRVQRGDKRAFDLLVRKYQHKLAKLVSRYVYDPDEVADVVQDTFLKAYRALARFRGDSAFYTWIYRIAINTAKNHLVALGRRPPDTDLDIGDPELGVADRVLQDHDTPDRLLQRDVIEKVIFETIDGLPEELRMAITLRELEGLSYEEIAQAMECPIGTVRSRIFRAREAIDNAIRPLLDHTEE